MRIWKNLWGAVFYDIGSVAADPWSLSEPGHGIGGGLRYYFPIGPVRVDVAYNPGPLFAASNRWAFHITFGFSY
jgi:outer membrane translocation and assembly module TamA